MERVKLFDSYEDARSKIKPEKPYEVEALGTKYCLVLIKDVLRIVQDKCPHKGGSLSQGTVNYLGEVVCPLHSNRFNLENGEEAEGNCDAAKVFEVIQEADGLYFYP